MKALREAVTAKQWRILELWAASYHKLGTDASAAPNLDAESRRFKVMVADALSAMLSAHETALREHGDIASQQLREAMDLAWRRWPGERLYTYIDPRHVPPTYRASRPTWGHCFYQCGWHFVGITSKGLHILAYEESR